MKATSVSNRCHAGKREGIANRASHNGSRARRGFTIIELLIVIVIISILMALLFPAFTRARENSYQASCQTNLKNIGLAVAQYKQDEHQYPSSIAVLLPATKGVDSATLKKLPASLTYVGRVSNTDTTCGADACPNPDGTGYLNSTKNLMCPDDELDDQLRTSYGDISTNLLTPYGSTNDADPAFNSRLVWNYYGYKNDGTIWTDVSIDPASSGYMTSNYAAAANDPLRVDTVRPTDAAKLQKFVDPRFNPIKNSMSNRFAPSSTIITHCIFHRRPTSNLRSATDIYLPDEATNAQGARDIVLRLDGSTASVAVSDWNKPDAPAASQWQKQNK